MYVMSPRIACGDSKSAVSDDVGQPRWILSSVRYMGRSEGEGKGRGGKEKALRTRAPMRILVIHNHGQGRHQRQDTRPVQHGVHIRALLLLLGCVRRLQDEDGLDGEEQAC